MSVSLCLGTRGSDLALWQARHVTAMLETQLGIASSIEIIKTRGDRIQNVAFSKMEGKGFFTQELQEALLDGRVGLDANPPLAGEDLTFDIELVEIC